VEASAAIWSITRCDRLKVVPSSQVAIGFDKDNVIQKEQWVIKRRDHIINSCRRGGGGLSEAEGRRVWSWEEEFNKREA